MMILRAMPTCSSNRLAKFLSLLPEEIEINNVVLIGGHPIRHGGFSNIYHGIYTNPNGERIEVALKVLRYSRINRMKAVVAWMRNLRRRYSFGLISSTKTSFLSSESISQRFQHLLGPCLTLVTFGKRAKIHERKFTVIAICAGLDQRCHTWHEVLHSMNIVHGDLCGRTILINNEGRACLTDFGLASFMGWDTSIKSSTRGGSTRWMAPELLLPPPNAVSKGTPASDVWAFGCVCCEIWSEGVSSFQPSRYRCQRYSRFHRAGNLIPEPLWVVAHRCWKRNPADRPEIRLLCELIAVMIGPALGNGFTATEELGSGSHTQASSSRLLNNAPLDEKIVSQPQANKGKKRVTFQAKTTVRFGPFDVDAGSHRSGRRNLQFHS
ncbi:kinase-like domain-containing protein [Mycena olivaceomarginata]|nr:kinase-like domain-containing protein [Mycena olivaceomarginata]